MPSVTTGAKTAGLIVGTSAMTAIVMFLWILRADGAFDPPPKLVKAAGSGNVDLIDASFNRAVQARFPVGSSESDLIRELVAQGFEPGWGGRNAIYKGTPVVCADEYAVVWDVDGADRLAKVSGNFRAICL